MPYNFKHVTIEIFDIHPIAALYKAPAQSCFQPAFAFLGDEPQYEQQFLKRTPVQTNSFVFTPLPVYEQEKSHFWIGYCAIATKSGRPDYWRLQLPFYGRVRDTGLTLNHPLQGITVSAYPSVYLTGIGWSVNLTVEVRGDIKKADLIALVGWLSRAEGEGFSFTAAGGANDRKSLFRWYNDRILEEVFPKAQPPHAGMKIVNQFVISLNTYEGDLKTYQAMPTDEKALMRSILYGRTVNPEDLAKEQANRPLLKIQITTSDTNFALTNFDYGSLIFLQREARLKQPPVKENKRKVECFANNIKDFLMTMHLLSQFTRLPGPPAPQSDLGNRPAGLATVLAAIPGYYTNLFAQAMYKNHKDLTAV